MILHRPREVKFQKIQKKRIKGIEDKANKLQFGFFGLKALENGRITAKQIEAARQAISRKIKRKGKIWIRIFPHRSITEKPNEIRMGKGKGGVSYWVCPVKAGRILYEVAAISPQVAQYALQCGAAKLPIVTKFIKIVR